VRDADVGGDVLQAHGGGTVGGQPALGGVEDLALRGLGAATAAGSFDGAAARGVGLLPQPARQTAAARAATTPLARLLATLEPGRQGRG